MAEPVGVLFVDDWGGRAQPTVGSAALDMRYMTKLSMPVALFYGLCFRLLPPLSSMDCDLISKIPFHLMVFIIAEETQIRQVGHTSEI